MYKYIIKVLGFGALVGISMLAVFSMADGTTDALYHKFTTPRQQALILGTSRAAQGIQPRILDSILDRSDVYNYAFTIPSSPYGEIYLQSIKRKLDTTTVDGLFVLEVNPWTFSEVRHPKTHEPLITETNNFIHNTTHVTQDPNLQYLIRSYKEKYINILKNKNRKGAYQTFFVEDDGWLRVTIESDMISTELRTKNKLETYHERLEKYQGPSEYRLLSLENTIAYLQDFGKVYIVRLPVIEGMLAIENELYPDFNQDMERIALSYNIPYLDFTTLHEKYKYTDGNHLDITSGSTFTRDLGIQLNLYEEAP